MMRRPAAIAVVLIGLGVLTWTAARFWLAHSKTTTDAIRQYAADQVAAVINAYIEPTLDFDAVDLQLPGTLRFTGARLISPDGTTIFDIQSFTVTLTELPKLGEPIRVARLGISGGSVHLVQDARSGRLKGFDPLLKQGLRTDHDEPEHPVPENLRLSSVLRLEHITLEDLAIVLDDGSGAEPMRIAGVNSDLAIVPDEQGPGWYSLDLNAGRSPGLTLEMAGGFNIDSLVVRVDSGSGEIVLDESTASTLPPPLQTLIRRVDARGIARVTATGFLPLLEPLGAEMHSDFDLESFNIAAGDYRLPIDHFSGKLGFADGKAQLSRTVASTMHGTVKIEGNADFNRPGQPAGLSWTIRDVQLREALRASVPQGQNPKLAGLLDGFGSATSQLHDPVARLSGQGEVHVRKGRLLVLPGMADLIQKIGTQVTSGEFNHTMDATFSLEPAGVRVTQSEVVTGILAARGTGTIAWDGALDLAVNAGPLERLQSALGTVGELFGKLTDRLVKYRIRGTLTEPAVSVDPLGIGG